MSHDHHENAARLALLGFLIFASACTLTTARAVAQGRNERPLTPMERVRERQLRREAQMETSMMIEALKRESRKRPVEESNVSASLQLKYDFENLQTTHNQMMEMIFSNNVMDYRLIAEASAEIRRRATRLKSNLPLPETEKAVAGQSLKGWDEIDGGQLKPALLFLDELIMRFVTNPIFQQADVLDLQQSSQAKRDLEDIIKMSGKIRKSAEKLAKAL